MIESDRIGAEEAVEIDQSSVVRGVVKVRALTLVEIDDNAKSIEQNVLGDLVEDARFRFGMRPPGRADAARASCARRLRKRGRSAHPLMLVGAKDLVNLRRGEQLADFPLAD